MSQPQTGLKSVDLDSYVVQVSDRIEHFLKSEIAKWNSIDPSIVPPLNALMEFFHGGGKRLRPAFCYLGYLTGSPNELHDEILNAGCALELLHNFALVHDDFMDRADTRRGIATVHRSLLKHYSELEYSGDIEHFSNSVAILAGDFAFTYADKFARGIPTRCMDVYDDLKVELFAGQQMDLDAVYRKEISKEDVALIAQYKSGKYTIERPLPLGALLSDPNANKALWEFYGKPLGEAFQLRDDLLGIFGDEQKTGKPVGDDIREGKFTLLIAESLERTSDEQREIIEKRGNPNLTSDEILEIVSVIESCGAKEAVEKKIEILFEDSMNALSKLELADEVNEFATYLARYVCWRES